MAKLNINGAVREVSAEADTPLLWVIREHVGLTGTKYGCGVAQCGACSVHVNGEVQRSCQIPLGDIKETDVIVTIEGLSVGASHPVQKAWAAVDVPQCGACSVHINGEVMRSCSIRVGDVKAGDRIVTIEGLSATSSHPVQKAWAAIDVPQCGYCQSGQIMAAAALLKKNPKPTDKDIDEAMTNICRCGTYQRIRTAVHMAADMPSGGKSAAVSGHKV